MSYRAIAILGRGIERVCVGSSTTWRPTRSIEVLSSGGEHVGRRMLGIDAHYQDAVIAGSNANTLAAAQLHEELAKQGEPPLLAIFAAGRPSYLSHEPAELSEGSVMADKFVRRLRARGLNPPPIVVQANNKNTKDDLESSLVFAMQKALCPLAFISVSVHLPRCKEIYRLIIEGRPDLGTVQVDFLAADDILLRRYRRGIYEKTLADLKSSVAYRQTLKREEQGLADLKAGTYILNPEATRIDEPGESREG